MSSRGRELIQRWIDILASGEPMSKKDRIALAVYLEAIRDDPRFCVALENF